MQMIQATNAMFSPWLRLVRLLKAEDWLLAAGLVSAIHHVDHILRVDHSGWPFIAQTTTFTYSLVVYPIIFLVLMLRGWPMLRAAIAFFLALAPTLAHTFVETPYKQFCTWAYEPQINLLGVSSPALGLLAGAITILLSVLALVAFVAFVDEARSAQDVQR